MKLLSSAAALAAVLALGGASGALHAAAGAAPAAVPAVAATATSPFVLNPDYCTPVCGASQRAGTSWSRPYFAIDYEEQAVEFYVNAADLLRTGQESVLASTFSGDEPFTRPGGFTANASGGGLGAILGSAATQFHPKCVGANAQNRQFGLIGYTWGDPYGSSAGIVDCKNVPLSALTGIVHVSVTTRCRDNVCWASATLRNQAQTTVLASVSASDIRITNPTRKRDIWYAVTNFYAAAPNYPVTFSPSVERYKAYPLDPPCSNGCP